MTKGKPYDFWNKNAMAYEVESLEKKHSELRCDPGDSFSAPTQSTGTHRFMLTAPSVETYVCLNSIYLAV